MEPANKRVSDDDLYNAYLLEGSISKALLAVGLKWGTSNRHRLNKLIAARSGPTKEEPLQFDPIHLPTEDRTIPEIVAAAIAKHDRVATARRAKLNAVLPIRCDGPFGVAYVPDRHMESPGSHLGLIFEHAKLMAATDGLFINDVGDSIDNFIIGKLQAARRETVVTVSEAWLLVEEYFRLVKDKLIAAISGNHLDWTTMMGGVDHLQSILKLAGCHALYDADELTFTMKAPNGMIFKQSLRHFFTGSSMWNAAHAVSRYVQSAAYKDEDVVCAGHLHIAGVQQLEAHGKCCLAIQVGSYKNRDLDPYCRQRGFMRQHAFLVPMVIFFPGACQGNPAGSVAFFKELEIGIPYLKWLRSRK